MGLGRRVVLAAVVIVLVLPFAAVGQAAAVPIVEPPTPPVVPFGTYTGTECVNFGHGEGLLSFDVQFVGTFEGVPFVDEGDFEYDVAVEFTGVDEGTWSMVKASDPTTSIAGTLVQATTSTGESILDVQYVDNLTVTSSSGDAAGVSGKIQLFGTRTEISYPEGCLFAFTTHGLLLSALHRRLTR